MLFAFYVFYYITYGQKIIRNYVMKNKINFLKNGNVCKFFHIKYFPWKNIFSMSGNGIH